jgi:hypothetical protein
MATKVATTKKRFRSDFESEIPDKCFLFMPLHRTANNESNQGCQTAYFQTKNPNLGKFWRVLRSEMLLYFTAILSILRPFCIFHGPLVYLKVICYLFPRFGMLYQEKSGNPESNARRNKNST